VSIIKVSEERGWTYDDEIEKQERHKQTVMRNEQGEWSDSDGNNLHVFSIGKVRNGHVFYMVVS
jgi:hypothetical protein